jgi:hypothetical protein
VALAAPDLVSRARPYAIASIALWALAVITGRLTAYPGVVDSIF